MCCTWLAENTERKKMPKNCHLRTITTLCGCIFATKACIDNQKKNLVKQQYLLRMSYNILNFGPLTAEIGSGVWGTPANFNWLRVLASLLHRRR